MDIQNTSVLKKNPSGGRRALSRLRRLPSGDSTYTLQRSGLRSGRCFAPCKLLDHATGVTTTSAPSSARDFICAWDASPEQQPKAAIRIIRQGRPPPGVDPASLNKLSFLLHRPTGEVCSFALCFQVILGSF